MTPALMVRAQCNRRFTQLEGDFDVFLNGSSIFNLTQSMFITKVGNESTRDFVGGRTHDRLDHLMKTSIDPGKLETVEMSEAVQNGLPLKSSSSAQSNSAGRKVKLSQLPKQLPTETGYNKHRMRRKGRKQQQRSDGSSVDVVVPVRTEHRAYSVGDSSTHQDKHDAQATSSMEGRLRGGGDEARNGMDSGDPRSRSRRGRRLAAIEKSGFLGVIKDKNWSPFFYRGRMLWSYLLSPHIVCEMEQYIQDLPAFFARIEPDDCILCLRKFATNNSALFNEHAERFSAAAKAREARVLPKRKESPTTFNYHLNGVSAFKVRGRPFYLGICHSISDTWRQVDRMVHYQRLRTYIHFFYKMEAEPPFRILAISRKIPLFQHRAVSSWFGVEEVVDVAFVSGLEYHPDQMGQEIMIAYGVGDLVSRVTKLSVEMALELFDD